MSSCGCGSRLSSRCSCRCSPPSCSTAMDTATASLAVSVSQIGEDGRAKPRMHTQCVVKRDVPVSLAPSPGGRRPCRARGPPGRACTRPWPAAGWGATAADGPRRRPVRSPPPAAALRRHHEEQSAAHGLAVQHCRGAVVQRAHRHLKDIVGGQQTALPPACQALILGVVASRRGAD
eukprot:scaffold300_cov258-Pinguiococcus_pyrenoidosus.AAC.57